VLPEMHTDMSQNTKHEVLAKLRRHYARAGTDYKRQLLDQAVALFGYHRKAATAPRLPSFPKGEKRVTPFLAQSHTARPSAG